MGVRIGVFFVNLDDAQRFKVVSALEHWYSINELFHDDVIVPT